jgi:ABC-type branched-subunit amino acid transport system substrate-binding protein
MIRSKQVWLAVAVVVCVLSCSGGTPPPPPKAPIPIGVVLSLTGTAAAAGTNALDAANLAVEEINGYGGVLGGAQLQLVVRDDKSDQPTAISVAKDLVSDAGVQMILGANQSANSLGIAQMVTGPAHVTQISGLSVGIQLSSLGPNGFFFRTVPTDTLRSQLLAKRFEAKGINPVAILTSPSASDAPGALALQGMLLDGGINVTTRIQYMQKQMSYTNVLTQVYDAGVPQAVVLYGTIVDCSQIIKDYQAGFSSETNLWEFASSSVAQTDFVTAVGANNFTFNHEGSEGTTTPNNTHFAAFSSAFNTKYGHAPTAYGQVNTYDAVYLLALALQAAGKADGQAVRDQMMNVSKGGSTKGGMQYGPTDFKAAIAALDGGSKIDYEGASGNCDFDPNGDVVAGFDIWKVENGAITVVETDVQP